MEKKIENVKEMKTSRDERGHNKETDSRWQMATHSQSTSTETGASTKRKKKPETQKHRECETEKQKDIIHPRNLTNPNCPPPLLSYPIKGRVG